MRVKLITGLAVVAVAILAVSAFAGGAVKNYQVTGPILEVTDTKIVVQKGDERWEIARDKDTAITGELKVGAKVTIQYQMYASSVEVKAVKEKE